MTENVSPEPGGTGTGNSEFLVLKQLYVKASLTNVQVLHSELSTLLVQLIPCMDREKKQKAREALRFLRKTGLKLLQDREAQITRGETVPEDILTQICRYKGQCHRSVQNRPPEC